MDRNAPEALEYEKPSVADYGDLSEITEAKNLIPPKIDGNYTNNQHVFTPFSG
jgi:hypothetical protein